ncbi:prepilin-type N-terminal cleavage/methylation domain-containing protein [Shewanella benthica]|uniref:prepilin-type N-terminal cleavage/methylation domain-containing protein n=1 Tax=Shewanella benthica TaxID=43661 RepID=UPI00187AC33A|nr:prepilin-type N-terminal cleavage/methylation domain-containing protein [Shewanella benthica]MBE7214451.1 prepilin-type N-terminal cleavage/methylation domain-containing protein [Shewanella benthica]MCL1061517.1 prepilin-type N-terminal cleavage/methylation domain-containing protein [Shewanella benthica]
MAANSFKKIDTQVHLAHKSNGFTLIELIVGMVVLSIGLVLLTSMLFPQADRAAETLHRVRSAELAHSLLNEIWSKRYDQNTNANGGVPACGAAARPDLGLPAGLPCTLKNDLGPDGENRNSFNDVDDYHGLTHASLMLNSDNTYASEYPNYQLSVTVTYPDLPILNRKLITIAVTTPNNEVITYNAVRSNY